MPWTGVLEWAGADNGFEFVMEGWEMPASGVAAACEAARWPERSKSLVQRFVVTVDSHSACGDVGHMPVDGKEGIPSSLKNNVRVDKAVTEVR